MSFTNFMTGEGKQWLRVEVTSAYYGLKDNAKFKWGAERQLPDTPTECEGKDLLGDRRQMQKRVRATLSVRSLRFR